VHVDPVIRELADERRRRWDGDGPRPVRLYLWSAPDARDRASLVLLSHGTGGSAWDLTWVAEPLARAGFLVAGVDHHGNNEVDTYLPEGFAFWWERAVDLSFVLDLLSAERRVESAGALGFSLGGYTAAALAGARIDPAAYERLIDGSLDFPPPPEFPDLREALRARLGERDRTSDVAAAAASYRDARVGAVFAICPAIAEVVDPESLRSIDIPVAVRWVGADEICPDARRYADLIPDADGRCAEEGVGHYVFFDSTESAEPLREAVAVEAVDFFRRHLRTEREPVP
jgi:predicted dienelactone hydrolase